MDYFPKVVQVIPQDNFQIQVIFDDGKIMVYDATEDLKSDLFQEFRDINKFKDACTVLNDTLAWDTTGDRDETKCIDIDLFTLYGYGNA